MNKSHESVPLTKFFRDKQVEHHLNLQEVLDEVEVQVNESEKKSKDEKIELDQSKCLVNK
jgi:hypothetical protein